MHASNQSLPFSPFCSRIKLKSCPQCIFFLVNCMKSQKFNCFRRHFCPQMKTKPCNQSSSSPPPATQQNQILKISANNLFSLSSLGSSLLCAVVTVLSLCFRKQKQRCVYSCQWNKISKKPKKKNQNMKIRKNSMQSSNSIISHVFKGKVY